MTDARDHLEFCVKIRRNNMRQADVSHTGIHSALHRGENQELYHLQAWREHFERELICADTA